MMPPWLRNWFRPRADGRMEPIDHRAAEIARIDAMQREIDAALAKRRAARPQRSQAARKGWDTRKAKA